MPDRRGKDFTAAMAVVTGEVAESLSADPRAVLFDPGLGPLAAPISARGSETEPLVASALPHLTPAPVEEYVLVGTGLPPESDDALHVAAWERGGPKEKSVIVREALALFLSKLADLEGGDQAGYAAHLAEVRADPRASSSRAPRGYRLTPAMRTDLVELAKRQRVPMAATLRAAVAAYLLKIS